MSVEHYIYDGQNILEETDEFGNTQASYTYEPEEYGELISQHRGGKTSYYHYDALGSTRQLTDDTETVTDSYTYNAWGETIKQSGTTTNPFRWIGNVGYYWDEETQDYYVRARYYQSTIGRWQSVDPLGFVDGFNLYLAYFIPAGQDVSGTSLLTKCPPECKQRSGGLTDYGCYCGAAKTGNGGKQLPIDPLDSTCVKHDACFDKHNCKAPEPIWRKRFGIPYIAGYKRDERPECRQCDHRFCRDLLIATCNRYGAESDEFKICRIYSRMAKRVFCYGDDNKDNARFTSDPPL